MPSTSILDEFAGRATTARNVSIYTAILTSMPLAYGFRVATGYGPGSFLVLVAIAVGVPTALDHRVTDHDSYETTVGRTVGLSMVVLVLFSALYVAGTTMLSLPHFQVAAVTFLVASLLPPAVLDGRSDSSR